jgi:hypothetical protein
MHYFEAVYPSELRGIFILIAIDVAIPLFYPSSSILLTFIIAIAFVVSVN